MRRLCETRSSALRQRATIHPTVARCLALPSYPASLSKHFSTCLHVATFKQVRELAAMNVGGFPELHARLEVGCFAAQHPASGPSNRMLTEHLSSAPKSFEASKSYRIC
jgi:hypothetical protein